MLDKEMEEGGNTTEKINEYIKGKSSKLQVALDDQKKIREESEEQLVQLLKEMMSKIKL